MDIVPDLSLARQDAVGNEGASLPCLFSNNCTGERQDYTLEGLELFWDMEREENSLHRVSGVVLSQQQKKSASALAWNVKAFADRYGLDHVGFLTLTFAEDVKDPKEAQRRFHSLRTHVLAVRYQAHIRVLERQGSGRIHYHLLVALAADIRSGFDFEAIKSHDYRSASLALREEWAFWRVAAPAHKFGRTELLPIRSTTEGIGRYVGKYVGKHLVQRKPEDKGVRLVEYSREARMASTRFSWATPGAAAWRRKVRLFSTIMCPNDPPPFRSFTAVFGPRWSFYYRDFIMSLPD